MMNFASIKEITIPEGNVESILLNGLSIWKKQTNNDYSFPEYLQFNADMAFDTCVICTKNTKIEAKFDAVKSDVVLYGIKSTNNTASITAHLQSGGYWRFGNTFCTISIDNGVNVVSVDNEGVILNGTLKKYVATVKDFVTATTLILGASTTTSGELDFAKPFVGKIYYFKMYENDEMILDYVPCVDADGINGFWDNVSQKFIKPIFQV